MAISAMSSRRTQPIEGNNRYASDTIQRSSSAREGFFYNCMKNGGYFELIIANGILAFKGDALLISRLPGRVQAVSAEASSSINKFIMNKQFFCNIGKRIFAELAASHLLMLSCAPFAAKEAIFKMLKYCWAGGALTGVLQVLFHNPFAQDADLLMDVSPPLGDSVRTLLGAIFSSLSTRSFSTLIHETGHAFAAWQCFQGVPSIKIREEGGGSTTYSIRQMTSLGESMGIENSRDLITLSGPALALFAASIALVSSRILQNSHSQISTYLNWEGNFIYMKHIIYALTAYLTDPNDLGHDFVRLRTRGIEPWVAAFSMLACWCLLPKPQISLGALFVGFYFILAFYGAY